MVNCSVRAEKRKKMPYISSAGNRQPWFLPARAFPRNRSRREKVIRSRTDLKYGSDRTKLAGPLFAAPLTGLQNNDDLWPGESKARKWTRSFVRLRILPLSFWGRRRLFTAVCFVAGVSRTVTKGMREGWWRLCGQSSSSLSYLTAHLNAWTLPAAMETYITLSRWWRHISCLRCLRYEFKFRESVLID